MQQVEIYTDGACSGNPGPGGWAALLRSGEHERELSGAEPATTNNRMELTAALRALEALKRPCRVVLYTDSTYVQKGMKGWVAKWKRNNWTRYDRIKRKDVPVLNEDLWRALDAVCARHQVEWRWVQAHAGIPDNERVDQLAREAIDSLDGEHGT